MKHLVVALGVCVVCAACTTVSYQSPAPSPAEVDSARAKVASTEPHSRTLTLAEAQALAKPIFDLSRRRTRA